MTSAEVFIFEEPGNFDWGQCNAEDRGKFLQWEAEESQVDGCFALRRPKVVEPCAWTLKDADVPALCLLDLLKDNGWEARSQHVLHSVDADKAFDDRNPIAKNSYLKCVLACDLLCLHGVESFPSGRANTFYAYIFQVQAFARPHPKHETASAGDQQGWR